MSVFFAPLEQIYSALINGAQTLLFNVQKWLLGVLDRHFEGKDALVLARSFIGKFENHKQSVTGAAEVNIFKKMISLKILKQSPFQASRRCQTGS